MREIAASAVTDAVAELCVAANRELPPDMAGALRESAKAERSPLGREVLRDLCRNLDAAKQLRVPICQDTGMAVVFLEVGQEVHIAGGGLEDAVNEGVRRGYTEGLLRLSVVGDPLRRVNTGDNTPAVIHTRIVPGDALRLTVAPKGFGSENMSAVRMFTPSAAKEEIAAFVAETVNAAGSKPCPPVVVGVGIGGFRAGGAARQKPCCARWMCARTTRSTARWRRTCSRASTRWASARRGSAAP